IPRLPPPSTPFPYTTLFRSSQQAGALERSTLDARLAGLDPLRGSSEEAPRSAPVFEHAQHARVSRDARDPRRVVHGVADQHAGARALTGSNAQKLIGHRVSSSSSGSLPRARRYHSLSQATEDRKSTRLNSSHQIISYAVFCL